MTWTDNRGRRMRTWIPAEVGTIADPQEFMETLVERATGILEREPIDIYVNPTFLPDADRQRLRPAVDRGAHEEGSRRPRRATTWPSKSTTATSCRAWRSCAWPRRPAASSPSVPTTPAPTTWAAVSTAFRWWRSCKLGWQDFFVPGAWWPKAVDRKPGALKG